MKRNSILVLLIWFFLLLCEALPVLADSPCSTGTSNAVQVFVSSLNSKIKAKAGAGLFEVKPIKQGEMITRWSITYKLSRRAIFLQDVANLDFGEGSRYVSAEMFNGHSSLIFIDRFGNRGSVGCAYAVFPQAGRFTALEIPYPIEIADFDRDNNTEFLVDELEEWPWSCDFPNFYEPYWPRIFRLDPQSGKLVDISEQFPEVYKDKLKEYQARYEEVKKRLSSECLTHYSRFLERLKQASIKTNEEEKTNVGAAPGQAAGTEWDALNKEVENLYNAKQYDRAVDVAKKALDVAEKKVSPDHPDVATSLNNLARIYFALGQYAQAEPLSKRALAIWEKALGPDHPDVATSLTNLAVIFRIQRQYAQAEPLYKRALVIREKALGPDNTDVAMSLNSLGALYYIQKQYAQAEPLLKRALEIWEKALGPDHPNVTASRKNIAALYRATNREQEAEKLEQGGAYISAEKNEDKSIKSTESYYPLQEGRSWEYQVFVRNMLRSSGVTAKVIVTNFAPRDLKGKKVTPQKTDAVGQSDFSFVSEDGEGIYEFASQRTGTVDPEIKVNPNYYFKYPIKVGTSWNDKVETGLLMEKISVMLKSTIESIDEVITVPAGTFKGCIKVKSIGTAKKEMYSFMETATISVEQYNWFALGVGLIKMVHKEYSNNTLIGFGEMTMQLESFKK